MQYHGASYAAGKWDVLWYEKNIFGDIVAIYNESGTKLISYRYGAYGTCTPQLHVYSDAAYNNPFRYRGYYYDTDLNLYYLNSRYYDSFTGRFISADNFDTVCATPNALTDKNLYAYCDNNPVMRRDGGGQFWDTAFDVVSLAFSVVDVVANPADPWAWAGLVGDVLDLIPFVSGLGEATDLMRVATKAGDIADAVDDIHDTAKALDRIDDGVDASKTISKTISTPTYTSRGSTGRTQPANLREQLAMEQVMSNPSAGTPLKFKMKDSRWPASEGWVKMQQTVRTSQGNIEIHYVYNPNLNIFDDFKFVP